MKKNIEPSPDGSWPITAADKVMIVELGRLVHKTVLDYARSRGELHVKIAAGSFQYFMNLQDQKKAALGDDIVACQKLLEDTGFGEKINEPFMAEEEKKPEEQAAAAAGADTAAEGSEVAKTEEKAEEGAEGAAAAAEGEEKNEAAGSEEEAGA